MYIAVYWGWKQLRTISTSPPEKGQREESSSWNPRVGHPIVQVTFSKRPQENQLPKEKKDKAMKSWPYLFPTSFQLKSERKWVQKCSSGSWDKSSYWGLNWNFTLSIMYCHLDICQYSHCWLVTIMYFS